ncbi:MAG: ribosome small subunit-dependent GTPase A [Gemmatimonadota bacterium]
MLRVHGGVYEVETAPGRVVDASLRGRLKREQRTGDRVVAGDEVVVRRHDDGTVTIEAVEPRRSELVRRAPGRGRRGRRPGPRIIVANVDQVVVVFAAAEPAPRLRMLDRVLVLAEANGLAAVVLVNKVDLADEAATGALFQRYEHAGYPVLLTSAVTGRGVADFADRLRAATSVLAGPSGVGKSSLLNAIEPGLELPTAEISEAVGKGRHTTVTARLIRLPHGGYVADTPGLRELGLWGVSTDELRTCFPEFHEPAARCRFGNTCTHSHEPDCGVREAAEAGAVHPERYASYLAMLESETLEEA